MRILQGSEDQPYLDAIHQKNEERGPSLDSIVLVSQTKSKSGELSPSPFAFVGSLPPHTPAHLDKQKQELAQDQDPRPERV